MPEYGLHLNEQRQIGVSSYRGKITLHEFVRVDDEEAQEDESAAMSEEETLRAAQEIGQKVQDGEIEVLVIDPLPWYDFLRFETRDYPKADLVAMGLTSWRWIAIPYWPLLLITGVLPAIWLVRRQRLMEQADQASHPR